MYLIDVDNHSLKQFVDVYDCPPYAALSHRWGATDEEMTFQEMTSRAFHKQKSGYPKMFKACLVAKRLGFQWVWIDTCCIDKQSSAELQESINSMWTIYYESAVCLAYLNDLDTWLETTPVADGDEAFDEAAVVGGPRDTRLGESEWFKRGWTLQELLAPRKVVFLTSHWLEFGTRDSLSMEISCITKIPQAILQWKNDTDREDAIRAYPIATRLSWAAGRQTKRSEDRAYSLLGLFGIHMPLLYGEGHNAFSRLQEEIIKTSGDATILLWKDAAFLKPHEPSENRERIRAESRVLDGVKSNTLPRMGLFAQSPAEFDNMFAAPENIFEMVEHSWAMTNLGLSVTLDMTSWPDLSSVSKTKAKTWEVAILWLGIGADRPSCIDHMINNGQKIHALCSYPPRKDIVLLKECTPQVESKNWAFQYVLRVELERGRDDTSFARRLEPLLLGERIPAQNTLVRGPYWSRMYREFRERSRMIIRRQRSNQEAGRVVLAELKQMEDVLRRRRQDEINETVVMFSGKGRLVPKT
ncbi:hypothetical protein MBLNU457_6905t2 [Dothideomycetes sp. NU457]